jgi:hypothetical protein
MINMDNSDIDVCVNNVANTISDKMVQAAGSTFGYKTFSTKKQTAKPWFDGNCKSARKLYHKSKKSYAKNNTLLNRQHYQRACKNYSKILKLSHRKYKQKCTERLRETKSKNPKIFWGLLKSFANKKHINNVNIDELYNHFKELNECDVVDECININEYNVPECDILDGVITETEIKKAVNNLKCNKACGVDSVYNEYIKATFHILKDVYVKLFNTILESGTMPTAWLIGEIKPIYKNKGSSTDPNNYRGITLVSCLGKLFTSIISSRLHAYSNDINLLSEAQAGFRNSYSTIDHAYVLKCLIDIYQSCNKKLFCVYIDFSKAFDNVWHAGLFTKMLHNNIGNKCFRLIYNMYNNIKSCVSSNNVTSQLFACNTGVRQGENLSPFLFALYLNDVESFLLDNNITGLDVVNEHIENVLGIYIKLLLLLYADDTVLMAETPEELQKALDSFNEYCQLWKFKINLDKTKVVIFSKGYSKKAYNFTLNGVPLESTKEYLYLGVLFSANGRFCKCIKRIVNQASKAMFTVLKIIRKLDVPIDCMLKLFDNLIQPILLYGCEVWGFENVNILERVHLKFCKYILNVKQSTPDYMVYGELGRFPLSILVKVRQIKFWGKIIKPDSKLVNIVYKVMYSLQDINVNYKFKLLQTVKQIFQETGMSYVWLAQNVNQMDVNYLANEVKLILTDQFKQTWRSSATNSTKGNYYCMFKHQLALEPYLLNLPYCKRIWITRLRTTNHRLAIETGRWTNIDRQDRLCTLCNSRLGDELHFLLYCQSLNDIRTLYLPKYYCNNPSLDKFINLMSICYRPMLLKLSDYAKAGLCLM